MRSAVLLLSLSVLPITASADALYDITFTYPGVLGYGTLTTDGTCISCKPGAGLLGFSFKLVEAPYFRLTFDEPALSFALSLDTSSRQLHGEVEDFAGDRLGFFFQPETPPFPYFELDMGEGFNFIMIDGVYTVARATAAVPETTSAILFASALAILGFLLRRTHVW